MAASVFSESTRRGFQWYDYVIFVATLAISLSIGVYSAFTGRGSSVGQYLTGNRKLKVLPVSLSMFMSYVSAVLVLGNTAETFHYGPMQWLACIGNSLANIFAVVFFVPLFYPLKMTSIFQYLEMRFESKSVRLTGTLLLVLSSLIYMGIAMYAPATALDAVVGFPTWASIVVTGVVSTFYTSKWLLSAWSGGISAVVWTDAFQAVVYVIGIIVVLIAGSIELGGFGYIWDVNMANGRVDNWDFTFNPLVRISFWSTFVGRFVSSLGTHGAGQTAIQRYCSLPTMTRAKWALMLNIPMFITIYTLTLMVGWMVFAFYHHQGCDPLRSGQISNSNQLLPFFIVEGLQLPGLSGLFVAILFSGCLSTLSSLLSSISAVVWKDCLEWKFHDLSDGRKALVTKLIAAIFGGVSIGMAFLAQILGGHVLEAAQCFAGSVSGPALGMILLGIFFPCANWIGALSGAWIGFAFSLFVTIGSYVEQPFREVLNTTVANCPALGFNETAPLPTNPPDVNPLFKMSFMWFSPMGTAICMMVGLLVSLLTKRIAGPKSVSDSDPCLIVPVFDKVMCCLPSKWLEKLRCGISFDEAKYDAEGEKEQEMLQADGTTQEKEKQSRYEEMTLNNDPPETAPHPYSFNNHAFSVGERDLSVRL